RRRAPLHRLQLRDQIGDFVRRVLGVEQDPVETAVRNDFRCNVAAQARPQADLKFALGERVFEVVALHFRHDVSHTNWIAIPPNGPKSACSVSPFCAKTTRVNEPARTMCPGSSACPCGPILLASQATPRAG